MISDHLLYPNGQLTYIGEVRDGKPCGYGKTYYTSGLAKYEGYFEKDFFPSSGKEYYENGKLKFMGEFNKGPRNYYGPRYYVSGKLYYETGELWYEGTFRANHSGSIGYPLFKGSDNFINGTEYEKGGSIKKVYTKETK